MNNEQRRFVRKLVHQGIQASLNRLIRWMPMLAVLVLLGLLIRAVVHFELY